MSRKRRLFTFQKAMFCIVKGRILQAKRRHIGKPLTVSDLQKAWEQG